MLGVLVFPRASIALVRAHASAAARVVAVDAGADACLAADVVPALVVGDMDSVAPGTLAALEARGAVIERHPAAKRDTDAAIALGRVEDCDEIIFVGAGGGRADHALANLHLLARAAQSARVVSYDEDATTWVVTPERPLQLDLPEGTVLSMVPFDAEVSGITYEGLAYPLTRATMRGGDPYGMSNEVTARPCRVIVGAGRLFVIGPL